MTANTTPCSVNESTWDTRVMTTGVDQRSSLVGQIHLCRCMVVWLERVTRETLSTACVACRGRHKPLTGQHDKETTAGQTQQLLVVLSAMDVMWFKWHIVDVDKTNGSVADNSECHSHVQKLYC